MKYNIAYYIFLQIIFFIVISSCGTISTYEQNSKILEQGTDIIRKWKLQSVKSINDSRNISSFETNITLEINNEYRAYGYSGCNSFFGDVKIEGNEIQFSSLISTSKGCPGKQNTEKVVLDALRNTNNYEVKGNMLYLKHDKEILAMYVVIY